MLLSFGVGFCRWVIGLVFAWSFLAKLPDVSAFVRTIRQFNLLPAWLDQPAAVIILIGEGVVVTTMMVGGFIAKWGFLFAGALLLIFLVALVSVVVRRIQTPCNCFGISSQTSVSLFEIARSIIFILFAIGGYRLEVVTKTNFSSTGILGLGLSGIMAAVLVLIVVQSKEFVRVLRLY